MYTVLLTYLCFPHSLNIFLSRYRPISVCHHFYSDVNKIFQFWRMFESCWGLKADYAADD